MKKNTDWLSWANLLSEEFSDGRFSGRETSCNDLTAREVRSRLVVRARWILLIFFAVYCGYAGSSFYFSRYGFFLTANQVTLLVLATSIFISYNACINFFFSRISKYSWINHFQIVLDFLFVTILIHLSGGAASWFWPVYLIVTIEASFLLDRSRDVWILGGVGGAIYTALLTLENLKIIPATRMPFVDPQLNHDPLYIILLAVWVTILNSATAVIANFLMSVIRRESQLLRNSEERLLNFLDSANDYIHCNNAEGEFLYCNSAMRAALGIHAEAIDEKQLVSIVDDDVREGFDREIGKVFSEGISIKLESVFMAVDGREIHVEGSVTSGMKNGESSAMWGIWRDITERKHSQAKLYTLAHHDNLTGLPNRILFLDRLKQAMALVHRSKKLTALLFLDLDRFKTINDTLGHPVGDKLLQSVAKRLTGVVREIDSVARFGGDEFTIILVNIEEPVDAEMVARKILEVLSKPYQIDPHELFVTASIGISIYPSDSADVDNLIKKADIAMYHAKGRGGNKFIQYDRTMDEHAHKRLVLENNLRKALELDELVLHYQPKVDILSRTITSMEALIRWNHPEYGLQAPGEFIPLAEETGLIVPIGEWVLERACLQNLEWQQQGLPKMRVAVNLSGYQLMQCDFMERVKAIIASTGIDPIWLEFEITETVIMQNPEVVINLLKTLRDIGIHISIDDFGTGYSSLANLKRFSVNTLKIDKSFVDDVVDSKTDAAITTAIIAMGNSLNLKVIAEGVETEGQYSFLKDTMCDEVQGYLISKPLPPEKISSFIMSYRNK